MKYKPSVLWELHTTDISVEIKAGEKASLKIDLK